MPIALTCDCGARFELDESLAGQEVACPECMQPLEAPAGAGSTAPPRTSSLALSSVVLALVGAFTVVGTTLAVLLGCAALIHISRRRGRLVGGNLAVAGIVVGLGFTALTLLLILRPNLVPIDGWMRLRTLASQVDTTGALEVLSRDGNVVLRRPSSAWGRVQSDRSDDPAVGDIQQKRELLLADLARHAYLDLGRLPGKVPLSESATEIAADLRPARPSLLGDDDDEPARPPLLETVSKPVSLESIGNWEVRECCYDVHCGGQKWRFLVRVYKKATRGAFDPRLADPVYVARGYAPKNRFANVVNDLKAAMDSILLPK